VTTLMTMMGNVNIPTPKVRILLGDDNVVLQDAVARFAELRGFDVLRAITGAGTIALAIEAQPNLVVLDMAFPDADGRDVLRKLKSDARTAHIPVIVWSGREDHDSDGRISLDLGAEDYVLKSGARSLITKIERVLLRLRGDAA
jgi:DNA-binding response OmpR family regulator